MERESSEVYFHRIVVSTRPMVKDILMLIQSPISHVASSYHNFAKCFVVGRTNFGVDGKLV